MASFRCSACERSLHPSCSSKTSRDHHFNRGDKVRCEECKKSNKDAVKKGKTSTCTTCNDTKPLVRFRLHQKVRKNICMDCERIMCTGCHTSKPNEAFEPSIVANFWKSQRKALCINCKARGITAKTPNLYTCTSYCGAELGCKYFDRHQLDKFKHNGRKTLVCKECQKLEKKKFDDITKAMKLKTVWKCTCGYNLGHSEKCQLYPKDRWPGGPKVTKEEYNWWLARSHYHKS